MVGSSIVLLSVPNKRFDDGFVYHGSHYMYIEIRHRLLFPWRHLFLWSREEIVYIDFNCTSLTARYVYFLYKNIKIRQIKWQKR